MEVPPELSAAAQGAPQQRRLVVANTHDETNYAPSSTNPRGNLTTKTQKCFIGANACTDAITTYTYDETGQVLHERPVRERHMLRYDRREPYHHLFLR